jgi:hypothetical protein
MKIKAHVPTQQYGFIEIEGTPEDKAEIERLYNHYAESPIAFKSGNSKRLTAYVGGEIDYDEVAHVYTWNGDVYLSGSQYAKQFEKPFDAVAISGKMGSKWNVESEDIVKMWELKAEISRDFGNAIHKALQLYEQFNGLAVAIEKESHVHDHPIIKNAVQSFINAHKDEVVVSEALIVNHKKKHAGQVDRLLLVDKAKKICRIQDFKTNADVQKSIEVYWEQLKFYAGIMIANGWTVQGLDIFWFNGTWETFSKESNKDSKDETV